MKLLLAGGKKLKVPGDEYLKATIEAAQKRMWDNALSRLVSGEPPRRRRR